MLNIKQYNLFRVGILTLSITVILFFVAINNSMAQEGTEDNEEQEVQVFEKSKHPIVNDARRFFAFLDTLEYTSRLQFIHDDNIFLVEENEEPDTLYVFTQQIKKKISKDEHYVEWAYLGDYSYYNDESTGILGHQADFLYSYRPFNRFSFGIGNQFNWLQDSSITSTIGDRILAVGYHQNQPSFEMKYELKPGVHFSTNVDYKFLDARDPGIDDYIDHESVNVVTKLDHEINEAGDIGFVGFEHITVAFPQISEKSSQTSRGFFGYVKKFPNFFHVTTELGFSNIDMDEQVNEDKDAMDYKISLETVFSVFTKLEVSYLNNRMLPSLRREYTQYGSSIAEVVLTHTLDPKNSIELSYSHETQDFDARDKLEGQPDLDNKTFINSLGIGYSHKLNDGLTLDLGYEYSDRDSDFSGESFTNNKYILAITAEF